MNQRLLGHAEPTTTTASPVRANLLQRKCACGGTPGPTGECEECRNRKLRRSPTHRDAPATVPPIVHEVLRSSGEALDANTCARMEMRFGDAPVRPIENAGVQNQVRLGRAGDEYERAADVRATQVVEAHALRGLHRFDFGGVRIHADARAAESARAVNALAYTVGRDIVFDIGQYAPQSATGQELLAHELVHVAQQEGSKIALQRKEKKTKAATSKSGATSVKAKKSSAATERPSCESSIYVFVDAPVPEPVSSSPERAPVGPDTRAPLPGDFCGGANKDFLQHFSPNLRYQKLSNEDRYWWKDVRDGGGWMRELTIKKADEAACTITRQRTTPCPNEAAGTGEKEIPSDQKASSQPEPATAKGTATVRSVMKCEAVETIDQFGQEYALFEDGTIRLEWGTDPHRIGVYVPDGTGRYQATLYDDGKLSLQLSSVSLKTIGLPEEVREAAENCTLE